MFEANGGFKRSEKAVLHEPLWLLRLSLFSL